MYPPLLAKLACLKQREGQTILCCDDCKDVLWAKGLPANALKDLAKWKELAAEDMGEREVNH